MHIHSIQKTHTGKRSRQVGRGGKRGKTSGRGTKGQKARAGRKMRPEFRDTLKKFPKRRGRGSNIFKSLKPSAKVVTLEELNTAFKAGDQVTMQSLVSHQLVSRRHGSLPVVKILSQGTIDKKLVIEGVSLSKTAKEKIEQAGGVVK